MWRHGCWSLGPMRRWSTENGSKHVTVRSPSNLGAPGLDFETGETMDQTHKITQPKI
jgi:hypothetical protein